MPTKVRSLLMFIVLVMVFIAPKIAANFEGAKVVPKQEVKFDWDKYKDSCVPMEQLPKNQSPPAGTMICITDEQWEKFRKKVAARTD